MIADIHWNRMLLVTFLLILVRYSGATFTLTQDEQLSNATGINVCVRFDYPPGKLYRDNVQAMTNMIDGCVFDNGYSSNFPGNGLDPSTPFEYTLVDNRGDEITDTFCTHKFSDNWEITRVLQLSLFTNHTFAVTNFHNCPQSAESVRQSSDKIIANTIRSGPNGVILAEFGHTASYVKLTITAVDFGWSLDYIIFRDGAQIASFIYPNYYLPGAQWTDNGVNPATGYHYQIEEQDRMNGLKSASEIVYVCTDPPNPDSVYYTFESDSMEATIIWNVPVGSYGKTISAQVTTDSITKQPLYSTSTNPFTWPAVLDPAYRYQFYVQLFIDCQNSVNGGHQYSLWESVVVRAEKPQLSVVQNDAESAIVDINDHRQFNQISLFVDGIEYLPAPFSYPHTVTGLNPGQMYTFYAEAEQFGETVQSSDIDLILSGEIKSQPKSENKTSDISIGILLGIVCAAIAVILGFIVLAVVVLRFCVLTNDKSTAPDASAKYNSRPAKPNVNITTNKPDIKDTYVNEDQSPYNANQYDALNPDYEPPGTGFCHKENNVEQRESRVAASYNESVPNAYLKFGQYME
ncbi:uncharacterized protein LOC142336156 isoform X2 [Convolutriloba macropyga]|uniref:uncharacterized protein LOC142336156 isoform X2 n=1 Tax=Convolutriloba macropyga TaxID=536237 RepID=UPI003F51B170